MKTIRQNKGRLLITIVLILTAGISVLVDLNPSHLYNTTWPPHAIFHDWAMLNLLSGTCLLGLWTLWRKSLEPEIGLRIATLIPLIFWFAFFYTTRLFPNSSLAASPTENLPKVGDLILYPNVIIAIVLSILALIGYRVARSEMTRMV